MALLPHCQGFVSCTAALSYWQDVRLLTRAAALQRGSWAHQALCAQSCRAGVCAHARLPGGILRQWQDHGQNRAGVAGEAASSVSRHQSISMTMASLKAAELRLAIDYAAPLIPSRLRVGPQDNACCDGASIGSQSMCAKSQSSGHVDASINSCIARLGYDGGNPFKSQLPPLMCVCAGALGHGDWTRRQPLHRHG